MCGIVYLRNPSENLHTHACTHTHADTKHSSGVVHLTRIIAILVTKNLEALSSALR